MVGEGAVLDAIQDKLPEGVTSLGVDAYALVEAGYDVNYANKAGITPLMVATEKGDAKLVRNLLESGARVMEKDKDGRTAMSRAKAPDVQAVFRAYVPGSLLAFPTGD